MNCCDIFSNVEEPLFSAEIKLALVWPVKALERLATNVPKLAVPDPTMRHPKEYRCVDTVE
jgi:hypothetical protein